MLGRDTAGQERYLSLAPLYYRGAHAAAIVYDITSMETFEKAKYWISELQKNASGGIGRFFICILCVMLGRCGCEWCAQNALGRLLVQCCVHVVTLNAAVLLQLLRVCMLGIDLNMKPRCPCLAFIRRWTYHRRTTVLVLHTFNPNYPTPSYSVPSIPSYVCVQSWYWWVTRQT